MNVILAGNNENNEVPTLSSDNNKFLNFSGKGMIISKTLIIIS